MPKMNTPRLDVLYRPACAADAEALHAVHAGRVERDGVDRFSTLEDVYSTGLLQEALQHAEAEGSQDQWLVAEVEDKVVGFSFINTWREDDGTWVYLIVGWVLPDWRGQGIGTHMLEQMEARARQLAASQHPGEKAELAANASSTEQDSTALLLYAGYRAGYTVLEMDLPAAMPIPQHPLPQDVEIRPVLPEHLLPLAEGIGACYKNEYDSGRYAEDYDPTAYVASLAQPRHDPTLWRVAWAGEAIVGQVLTVIKDGRAEVFEVSVSPAWRRRGLGRALLSQALQELRRRGVQVIRLHTVAEFKTQAWTLYQSVGFRILKEFPRYRKEMGI